MFFTSESVSLLIYWGDEEERGEKGVLPIYDREIKSIPKFSKHHIIFL
jgi:hypothetical protein